MPAGRTTRDRKRKEETNAAALRRRITELTALLEEAMATLSAIRAGEVDAVIVAGVGGDRIFTLEGAEHAYRVFLEDMGEGAVTLTRDGVILYVNRRFAEIVGFPPEQVIGSGIFRFLSRSDVEVFRDLLSSAMSGPVRREVSLETQSGSLPALLSFNQLPESNPPALCMVVTDLTEQERAQRMLLEAHRTVAESEERFRFLVNRSLVGFFIVKEGRIIFANAEQQRIFGSLPIPVAIKEMKNIHPEDKERFERLCDESRVSESGMIETDIRFNPEKSTEDTKGPLWTHCRSAPIEYKGGRAILVNMADVTQAREMEQIAILQDKMASLGELTAGIAHNIRNPLAAINLYLSSMGTLFEKATNMDAQIKEEVGRHLEMLLQGSRRIGSVIRQVLAFAKPSSPVKTRILVDDAIRETLKICRTLLRNKNVAVHVVLPEGLPPCYAGSGLLEQVFMNVINNAAQELENHPGDRRIAISVDQSGGFIVVRIGDSGPGVPAKIRSKIFEPFFTTRAQGTGIGLAFSRRVLNSLGGTIEVGASPLGGAEFLIRIPAGKARKAPRDS
jgi:PAS domain S-box-containing protein